MPRQPTASPDASRSRPLRRLGYSLALLPLLAGLALLPLFLQGRLDGLLAAPVYGGLLALTVLVGSLVRPEADWAVPLAALVGLAAAAGGLWLSRPLPLIDAAHIAAAWRLDVAGPGLPAWWPLVLAVPPVLVLLVETVRGETPLPAESGLGGLEGLAGRPAVFGLVLLVFGVAGTLFAGSTVLEKVAVVAPIFEEYAKLGVGLLALTALGLSRGAPAFAAGALAGLAFGLLEHGVTYSSESQALFVVRALFHTLAAGLSALVYVHLRRRETLAPGAGWLAIAPSALVHAANNVTAIVVGIGNAVGTLPADWLSVVFGGLFVSVLAAAAALTVLRPEPLCGRIADLWTRLNSHGRRVGWSSRVR